MKIKKFLIFFLLLLSFNIVNASSFEKYNISDSINLYEKISLSSKNIVLYNLNDNEILFENNSNDRVQIASLTKIMTALVAIENIDDLDKKIIFTYNMFSGLEEYSKAGFKVFDEVTYRELLYGVILPSGADAVNGIVLSLGTKDEFIDKMNKKAKSLGMNNTHFDNAIGMDSDDNYSTANDLLILLKNALSNKTFYEIFATREYKIDRLELVLESTLLKYSQNTTLDTSIITGAKSGFTDKAGLCLASFASIDSTNYLLINLNADYLTSRSSAVRDAVNIYKYFEENYSYKKILEKDKVLYSIKNKFGIEDTYQIISNKDILKYLSNDIDVSNIKYNYDGVEEINYKYKKGDRIGTISILLDDKVLDSFDVYIDSNLKYYHPVLYFIVFLLLVMILLLLRIRKIKRRRKRKKHRRKK